MPDFEGRQYGLENKHYAIASAGPRGSELVRSQALGQPVETIAEQGQLQNGGMGPGNK